MYERLPYNASGASELLVLGGRAGQHEPPPSTADVAVNYDDPVASTGARVRAVGDLAAPWRSTP